VFLGNLPLAEECWLYLRVFGISRVAEASSHLAEGAGGAVPR